MGWTNIALGTEYAVNEVLTSSKVNAKINDNLRYLHGDDGTVAIGASMTLAGILTATAGGASQNILLALSGNAGQFAGVSVGRTASESHFAVPGATNQFFTGTQAGDMLFKIDDNSKNIVFGGTSMRAAFTSAGVGFGTVAPAGALHVLGAGAIAGAGFTIGSVAAVSSIQTVFAAGTVARGATAIILDRDNTGPVMTTSLIVGVPLSGSTTYTCIAPSSDVITVAVTAGGAVTVQRTTGTHGTHDITMFLITT